MQVKTHKRPDDAQISWHEISLAHYWFRLRVYVSLSNQCGTYLAGIFYRFRLGYSSVRDWFLKGHTWEVVIPLASDPFPIPWMNTNKRNLDSQVDLLEIWPTSTVILHLTCTQESLQRRLHGCNLHSIFLRLQRPLGRMLVGQANPRFFILFPVSWEEGCFTCPVSIPELWPTP